MPAAVAEADDGLKKLEYLSLVSKVCTELESHVGCGDKILAEFITELGRNAESVEEFDAKLKENGAEMPDYFVRTLLTIIHAILPPNSKSKPTSDPSSKKKSAAFPGLSRVDDRERVKKLEREIEKEVQVKADEESKYHDRDRDRGRNRERHRDRDLDRDRRGHHDRDRDHRYDLDRDRGRRNRRDDYSNHRTYSDDGIRHERTRSSGRISDEPELYQVYKGKVLRLMDNGCFVELSDFRGKEGLVHVSQISNRRVTNAKDEVKRGQNV